MTIWQSVRKSGWWDRKTAVAIALFGLAVCMFHYREHLDPTPSDGDLWEPVMAAYPNGGVDCHVSVVDRILHASDLLRDSPYVDDDLLAYEAKRQANELALDMVLGEDSMPPPLECGGRADGAGRGQQRHSMDAAQMGARSP